jgi:hypothetical protein
VQALIVHFNMNIIIDPWKWLSARHAFTIPVQIFADTLFAALLAWSFFLLDNQLVTPLGASAVLPRQVLPSRPNM